MTLHNDFETRMNAILGKMQIPLRVVWLPTADSKEHARIIPEEGLLTIYDKDEDEAWRSLFHECLEYRLRSIVSPYREIINKLIEAVEQITYKEKEKVLDQVMNDFAVWRSFGETLGSTDQPKEKKGKKVFDYQ